MTETTFYLEEQYDELKKFVKSEFVLDNATLTGFIKGRDDVLNTIIESITEALIRYNEGIETVMKSDEVLRNHSEDYVMWVHSDGIHAISFTNALKEGIQKAIIELPFTFFLGGKNKVIVTALQILISTVKNNSYSLKPDETYIYGLCCLTQKQETGEYFSTQDIQKINEQGKDGVNYKELNDEMLMNSLISLEKKGLIRKAGTLYKLLF